MYLSKIHLVWPKNFKIPIENFSFFQWCATNRAIFSEWTGDMNTFHLLNKYDIISYFWRCTWPWYAHLTSSLPNKHEKGYKECMLHFAQCRVVYFTFLSNNFYKANLIINIVDCVLSPKEIADCCSIQLATLQQKDWKNLLEFGLKIFKNSYKEIWYSG